MDIITVENFWNTAQRCNVEKIFKILADLSEKQPDTVGKITIDDKAYISYYIENNQIIVSITTCSDIDSVDFDDR